MSMVLKSNRPSHQTPPSQILEAGVDSFTAPARNEFGPPLHVCGGDIYVPSFNKEGWIRHVAETGRSELQEFGVGRNGVYLWGEGNCLFLDWV